jgi:pSer/pThr/pTyr-binding forkhead associated (FHA) protein
MFYLFNGNMIPLNKSVFTVGRDPTQDIVLTNEFSSRFHARLRVHLSGVFLNDSDSLNGTYINDTLVSFKKLKTFDTIHFGGNDEDTEKFTFVFVPDDEEYFFKRKLFNI